MRRPLNSGELARDCEIVLKVGLGVIEASPNSFEEGVRLPARSETQHLLHSGVSQLAAAILLDGKRLQSYAREIVRLAQPAGNLFRQFNSNVRQRGDIVRGTGGVRKARVADTQSGRGKRGSYRYLYLYPEHRGRIYLLYLYGKGEQSELSPEQKKTVASLAQMIKEESK